MIRRLLPLDFWLPLVLCLVVVAYTHTAQFSGCNADPGTGALVIVCVQP